MKKQAQQQSPVPQIDPNIELLQQQINKLKRRANYTVNNTQRNEYASSAKIAEELTDGLQRIFFNNTNKTVVFRNNNTPISSCIHIGTNNNTINNVNAINFNTISPNVLNGLTDNLNSETINVNSYVPTVNAVNTKLENYSTIDHNHDSDYAAIDHNHNSTYAAIIHNHDDRYALLNNIVNEIQQAVSNEEETEEENNTSNESTLIPNVTAIKEYCKDFITPTSLAADTQLQNLIRGHTGATGAEGKSAFEVWAEHQPIRYDQDGTTVIPYTYNEYIRAITGPEGLSAYEIWCLLNGPSGYDQAGNPIYPNEAAFIQSLCGEDGEDFLSWYIRIREPQNADNLTWEDICKDIVQSATVTDESGNSLSLWDWLDIGLGLIEGAGEVGIEGQIQALQAQATALQAQIFVLQGAVGSILTTTVGDQAITGVDTIVNNTTSALNTATGGSSSNVFQSIGDLGSSINTIATNSANTFSSIGTTLGQSALHVPLI